MEGLRLERSGQELFRKALLKAFPHLAAHSDEATLAKFKRIIQVSQRPLSGVELPTENESHIESIPNRARLCAYRSYPVSTQIVEQQQQQQR